MGPFWLERQRGDLSGFTNRTQRNWTIVGIVGSTREAIVDPRGLVTPWPDGWSVDWWIGAEDRWHFPSREAGVRQRLVDAAPVVETAMRIPGGDAVHRAYAVAGDDELVAVEIENQTPTPFAVALAIRPYNPEGLAVVERIALDGSTVLVDGRAALLLPRPPSRVAGSTLADGDSVAAVTAGDAEKSMPDDLRCAAGLAQAAFLFPVAHGTTLRVVMRLRPDPPTRRRRVVRRRVPAVPTLPSALPAASDVARGWQAQTRRGLRLELPAGPLAEAVEANRRFLLLFHGDEIRDAASLLPALDRFGFHAEAAEVLRSYPRRQQADGFLFSQSQDTRANGRALFAMAEHWRLTGDEALLEELTPTVERALQWIERKRVIQAHRRDVDVDDFWSLRGLLDGAELLRAAGRDAQADAAEEVAGSLRAALDAGMIGSLVAGHPLALLTLDDPRLSATAELVRDRFCIGDAVAHGDGQTGLGPSQTLQLASVELEAGDRRALDRLRWLVGAATPTWTWPEAIHPQHGGGCMGDGHNGRVAADFLSFARALLVRETTNGLALCSMLPEAWEGQNLAVHDAPTRHGTLSFALRWHGDRPALLWDLQGDRGPVCIEAPGLDPAWSATEPKGEALLSAAATRS